jgi:hypothetical protein
MQGDDPAFAGAEIAARLEAYARGSDSGEELLPWTHRLGPEERHRLRGDLAVVLAEPSATGEPLDWREIGEILQESAESAGWDDLLVTIPAASSDGAYAVHFQTADTEALAATSPAVRETTELLITRFLTHHPTAWQFLPRGRLKKMAERDTWQLHLPDGYRLRYVVDKAAHAVHVVYLGPHPDRDTRGRERTVRVRVNRRKQGEE